MKNTSWRSLPPTPQNGTVDLFSGYEFYNSKEAVQCSWRALAIVIKKISMNFKIWFRYLWPACILIGSSSRFVCKKWARLGRCAYAAPKVGAKCDILTFLSALAVSEKSVIREERSKQ